MNIYYRIVISISLFLSIIKADEKLLHGTVRIFRGDNTRIEYILNYGPRTYIKVKTDIGEHKEIEMWFDNTVPGGNANLSSLLTAKSTQAEIEIKWEKETTDCGTNWAEYKTCHKFNSIKIK